MERPVGDKFKINGCVYVVVEDASSAWEHSCGACVARCSDCSSIIGVTGYCDGDTRSDRKSVHFEHFGVDF